MGYINIFRKINKYIGVLNRFKQVIILLAAIIVYFYVTVKKRIRIRLILVCKID